MKQWTRNLALTVTVALGTATHAGATVLTFDGLTSSPAESMGLHQGYGGFVWNTDWYLFDGRTFNPPGSESPNYGIVNNFGNQPVGLTSPTPFSFNGVSAAQWGFNAPSQIRIVGFDALNNQVGDTGLVNIGPTYAFIAANFANVSRVDFLGGQFFALDDVIVNTASPVPEPATMTLFGTGVLGLAARYRRRRAALL